jgi:hypothetical protein
LSHLSDGGLTVTLPSGWDGQIRPAGRSGPVPTGAAGAATAFSAADAAEDDAVGVVLHAASFALPAERGDYGSGAVEVMSGSDVLVCLLEHPPEDLDAPLFRRRGRPRLGNDSFSPQTMQRAMPGMAGAQHFFQEAGRPFCLYVVVGSFRTRGPLVRVAAAVVGSLRVDPL